MRVRNAKQYREKQRRRLAHQARRQKPVVERGGVNLNCGVTGPEAPPQGTVRRRYGQSPLFFNPLAALLGRYGKRPKQKVSY